MRSSISCSLFSFVCLSLSCVIEPLLFAFRCFVRTLLLHELKTVHWSWRLHQCLRPAGCAPWQGATRVFFAAGHRIGMAASMLRWWFVTKFSQRLLSKISCVKENFFFVFFVQKVAVCKRLSFCKCKCSQLSVKASLCKSRGSELAVLASLLCIKASAWKASRVLGLLHVKDSVCKSSSL